MSTIFGAIGYTILKNRNNEKKILIFADMHDHLKICDNSIIISEWLKGKILNKNKKTILILEEVPRINGIELKLKELWSTSLHTQKLKHLSIDYPNEVISIDIRTLLIPFNLEIAKPNDNDYKVTLKNYLVDIDNYFNKFMKFYNNLSNDEKVKLTIHFNLINNNYKNLLNKYKNVMDKFVTDIKNIELTTDIEKLLSDIMELNICVYVMKHINDRIIIHVGLAHSEKVIELLTTIYSYDIKKIVGINKLNELNYKEVSGCQQIDNNTNNQFGGKST